ncbi:hypothetical protein [Hyalangium versicolor]|uniref:hypothetical protein n=1 Tax=Hyalangium versicolor TaxID=2861190 RepID=UPI001CCBC84B|nr:hypothetical protein [Hyalangium versicolor]
MSHGHRSRGPVGRISGLPRVESADVIARVRSTERVSGATAVDARMPQQRSFAEALERNSRGLVRSEPLPLPEPQRRPLPPPVRLREDASLEAPERLPESFLGLLWWKVKGRL